jgi:hypothetical protein
MGTSESRCAYGVYIKEEGSFGHIPILERGPSGEILETRNRRSWYYWYHRCDGERIEGGPFDSRELAEKAFNVFLKNKTACGICKKGN